MLQQQQQCPEGAILSGGVSQVSSSFYLTNTKIEENKDLNKEESEIREKNTVSKFRTALSEMKESKKKIGFQGEVIRIASRSSAEKGKNALQKSLLSQKGRWCDTGDKYKYVLGFATWPTGGGQIAAHDFALTWSTEEAPEAIRLFLEKKTILKVCFDEDLTRYNTCRTVLDLATLTTQATLKELALDELSAIPDPCLEAYAIFRLFSPISSKYGHHLNLIYDVDQITAKVVAPPPPPPPSQSLEEEDMFQKKKEDHPTTQKEDIRVCPTPRFYLGKHGWPSESTKKPAMKKGQPIEIDPSRIFDVPALEVNLETLPPAKAIIYKAIMGISTQRIDINTLALLKNIKSATIIGYLDQALQAGYPYDLQPIYDILGGKGEFQAVANTLRASSLKQATHIHSDLNYNQIILVQHHLARAAAAREKENLVSLHDSSQEVAKDYDGDVTMSEFRIFLLTIDLYLSFIHLLIANGPYEYDVRSSSDLISIICSCPVNAAYKTFLTKLKITTD